MGNSRVSVKLFESWPELKTRGGSLSIMQGNELWQRLGISIPQIGLTQSQISWSSGDTNIARLDLRDLPTVCTVMRSDLQKCLVDSLPDGLIHMGRTVAAVHEGNDQATLEFTDGSTEEADLVVAADGAHSKVAQCSFDGANQEFLGKRIWYAVSPVATRKNPTSIDLRYHEVDGKAYNSVSLSSGKGALRHDIAIIMDRCQDPISNAWDSTGLRKSMKEVVSKLDEREGSDLHSVVDNATNVFQWGVYKTPLRSKWTSGKSGRVVLIGDAAHATSPFMGQGANLAMMDGYCLGRLLATGRPVPEVLQEYEDIRHSDAETIVRMSSMIGNVNTTSGWKASVRDFVAPVVLPRLYQHGIGRAPVV